MAGAKFDPERVMGCKLIQMDRQELCEFVSALCRAVIAEVGIRGRRGGIYPENISVGTDGSIALGEASKDNWAGQELDFIAPELYWNGQLSAASDVYSIGMLLYYSVNNGKLPCEGECDNAQLRRMGGENFPAPSSAGRRLAAIIEKSTRFKSAERYQTLDELRRELDDCLRNLYTSDAPSAESIFKKSDDELDDVERMMVGIIEKVNSPEGDKAELESAEADESVKVPLTSRAPEQKELISEEQSAMLENRFKAQGTPASPKLTANETEPLKPVNPMRKTVKSQGERYTRDSDRERKIAEEVKKRRRRPFAVILVLCAILIMLAIVMNAMLKDFQQARTVQFDNQIESVALQSAAPSAGQSTDPASEAESEPDPYASTPEPTVEPTPEVTPAPTPIEHSYEVIKADISWTEAQKKCTEMGGHLVVISDEQEFAAVVNLAQAEGITRVWIGCHRIGGVEAWETGEDGYFRWAKGEPTYIDTNDQVAEDYIMLWNNNGWAYNDNRDDPCKDYPQMYSGTMGYICELGD